MVNRTRVAPSPADQGSMLGRKLQTISASRHHRCDQGLGRSPRQKLFFGITKQVEALLGNPWSHYLARTKEQTSPIGGFVTYYALKCSKAIVNEKTDRTSSFQKAFEVNCSQDQLRMSLLTFGEPGEVEAPMRQKSRPIGRS